MASRIRDVQSVGPPSRQISPKLITRVVDQFQSCFLPEVRSRLSSIKISVLPHAEHLDELTAAYNKVRGTFKYQEAETIQRQLITTDNEIATTLISQIELAFRECEQLLKQLNEPKWKSPQRIVKIEHARDDKHRMGRLYAWLNEHKGKPQERLPAQKRQVPTSSSNPIVQRPIIRIPRKQDYSESEFNPDSSPERPVKKARPTNRSENQPVIVLDLCSDSDDHSTARHTMKRTSRPALGAPSKIDYTRPLAPADHTNFPLARPKQALRVSQPDDHLARMAQGIEAAAKGLRNAHQDGSTKPRTSNQYTTFINKNVASDILRAVGRHPTLPPLNQGHEQLLGRIQVQKHSRNKTTGTRAELQEWLVQDAKGWWEARK